MPRFPSSCWLQGKTMIPRFWNWRIWIFQPKNDSRMIFFTALQQGGKLMSACNDSSTVEMIMAWSVQHPIKKKSLPYASAQSKGKIWRILLWNHSEIQPKLVGCVYKCVRRQQRARLKREVRPSVFEHTLVQKRNEVYLLNGFTYACAIHCLSWKATAKR